MYFIYRWNKEIPELCNNLKRIIKYSYILSSELEKSNGSSCFDPVKFILIQSDKKIWSKLKARFWKVEKLNDYGL